MNIARRLFLNEGKRVTVIHSEKGLEMKDFEALIKQCIKEVEQAGIKPGKIDVWKINTRSKKRWGQCTKHTDGTIEIQIAHRLLADDRITEKACKETIIHELLHSCPECSGHTGKWREYAACMNRLYGYHIKRVTSGEEKGVENYTAKRQPARYVLVCRYCRKGIERKQKCKLTKYYRNYSCPWCGMPHAFERYQYVHPQARG